MTSVTGSTNVYWMNQPAKDPASSKIYILEVIWKYIYKIKFKSASRWVVLKGLSKEGQKEELPWIRKHPSS